MLRPFFVPCGDVAGESVNRPYGCGAYFSQGSMPTSTRGGSKPPPYVGALRKCAGGTFLATDRSGYAARREVGGSRL